MRQSGVLSHHEISELKDCAVTQTTSGLTVRQYEREHVRLPVELTLCSEHSAQVRFSQSSTAAGQHKIKGQALDLSPGGMGIQSRQFIPRMCEGTIRLFEPVAAQDAVNDPPPTKLLFEHRVKVRRVYLQDREPTYAIGLAFISPQPGIEKTIASLLERFGSAPDGGGTNAGESAPLPFPKKRGDADARS
jgi:hypothetical protein